MPASTRLAVDIGGTFTDLVLALPDRTLSSKRLTTHDAPERAVIAGTQAILAEAGISPAALDLVIHGTTLATNALIERKGARTALVTTKGFRDSLEIAYEHRFEQYDLYMELPQPLVSREWRLEVAERLAADGTTLLALDTEGLAALAETIRAEKIEAVAISFLHAYVNPAHEQQARDILAPLLPGVAITLSSEVCREIREYERTSTTVANAYVLPLMARYLERMQTGLRGLGAACPLLLMMSSGGICTVETACRFPVRLVESGPAGGAILARHVAARGGYDRALAFDMGGTTAKITLIDDYTPQQSRHFEVARAYRFAKGSGIPVRIPVIDMVEIGAGGGSIARVDALGRIAVGPDSAGSDPGPACYSRGGTAPTVTDADVVLGRIDPASFAGGKIGLDPRRAHDAVAALPLALPVEQAARGIAEIVDETMASAARVHAVENGRETGGRTLIAFGGAAPLHAARLAQKLGIARVVIPRDAGVGSAHGFLHAPIAYEVVRTRLVRLDLIEQTTIDTLFAGMRAEAESVVRLGVPTGALAEVRTAFMRYRGQGHEIAVPLTGAALDPAALRVAFETTYTQLFGRIIPKLEIEALTWTLALSLPQDLPRQEASIAASSAVASGQRRIVESSSGEAVQAAVFERESLTPGAVLQGPAAIMEAGTTTIVPSGFSARIGAGGDLVLEAAETERETTARGVSEIELQIMWNRLLSVVEEQGQTLVRTAFSTSSREAGDISAGVFDLEGRMLAQAVTGTPGHINTMARSVGHFLDVFPVAQMAEGDVFVTNDPWKGTGHLYDLVVVSPTCMDGRIVALFACTAHLVDMGGVGQTPEGRQIYHEGLYIPLLRLARAGEMNEDLLAMIRANVREPIQVVGDVYALIACNEIGSRRLVSMMREFGLSEIASLGHEIIVRSRRAMAEAIAALPKGTWHAAMRIDGYEAPADLVAAVTIGDDTIDVDFTGSSGMSSYAINCPLCYTEAYTTFGINCVIAPHVPNNAGTLAAVRVTAPEGTIVSATHPAAVYARSVIGHMLPDVVYGALEQAIPGRVPAEGTSNLWTLNLIAGHGLTGIGPAAGTAFMVNSFHSGGAGARPAQDGLSATPFPSGVRNVPVEAVEAITPLVIWRKELRQDSGGPGRHRGGLGQIMEVASREAAAFGIFARFERVQHPARGRNGGASGATGRLSLASGAVLKAKGLGVVPAGDRLVIEMPGGGGMGPARERDPEAVKRDVRLGYVSGEAGEREYGVAGDTE